MESGANMFKEGIIICAITFLIFVYWVVSYKDVNCPCTFNCWPWDLWT